MESKTFCLINSSPPTDCLDSLNHQCNVASLSLFYHYFHADCSFELTNCMPSPLLRPCCTRLSISSHLYSVHFSNAKDNQYLHYFIPYTSKLWNSLPLSVFPPAYVLNSFKRGVSRKLDLHPQPLFLLPSSVQGLVTNGFFIFIFFVVP